MKIVLIILIFFEFLYALNRPKIALVLSGGGARGGAHVGVLKVLEKKRIPIDLIVGTSMGAFIGGLYSAGKSPKEIESMLVLTNWKQFIRTDFDRKNRPMRAKKREYNYQGKLSLGIDKNSQISLPTGVFNREPILLKYQSETQNAQGITNFDNLQIPFRSVATNIKNGQRVVLDSGSLAKAIYASTAIPGVFQPIKINGIDLIDGGISNNIPIEVAKDMGADIIIAVDASEDFDKNISISSYLTVLNQLVNILMRKNANISIAKLKEKDILIKPKLNGFGGLDIDKYKEIIETGVVATNQLYDEKLSKLSLSKNEYSIYQKNRKSKIYKNSIFIDKIVIENETTIDNAVIQSRLKIYPKNILNENELRKNILEIYNLGIFDSIDYEIIKKSGQNILKITTTPSWNSNGEINFAFGFEDNFNGRSSYLIKAGYTMFGLNSYGGEWKSDIEIGRNRKFHTEYFQPLRAEQDIYARTALLYSSTNRYLPISTIGLSSKGSLEVDTKRYGIKIALGINVFKYFQLEAGLASYRDTLNSTLFGISEIYEARQVYSSLAIDTLDNLNFPNSGVKSKAILTKEASGLGSDYDYEQLYLDFKKPFTLNNHNLTLYLKYGQTHNYNDKSSIENTFSLGGLFNLSGISPYSINGENIFLGILKYRYRLKNGGIFGKINTPLYIGFSLETGNAWNHSSSIAIKHFHNSAAIYLASDTLLGPFYLAYGYSKSSENLFYMYLGRKF